MTAKLRQYFYLASGAIAGIVPILVFLHAVSADQAMNLTELVGNIGGLLGATGAVTAGVIVSKQRSNGTVGVSPVDQVINNIPVIVAAANDALSDLDKVKQAATDALNTIPVLGPLAKQAIDSIHLP